MNYFELFNIPVSLKIDKGTLAKRYFELQKKYHPDFFTQAAEDEQNEVLEKSSAINKAFKIFKSEDETIKYLLQQKGLLQEEEKYQLPPGFLMEMMEFNEQLMDAKMEGDPEKLQSLKLQVTTFEQEIYEAVKTHIENYKDGISTQKELLQVKEYYYKKKYLNRILAGID